MYVLISRTGTAVHFSSTDAYFDVYHSRDTRKDPEFYDAFFVPGGTLATLDHAEARKHRKPMLQMFSRKATLNNEGILIGQAERLCELLHMPASRGQSIDIYMALRCFASDITTQYVFGFTFDSLGSAGFQCPTLKAIDAMVAAPGACGSSILKVLHYSIDWRAYKVVLISFLADDPSEGDRGNPIPLFTALTTIERNRRVPSLSYLAIMSDTFTMIFSAAYAVGTTLTVATYYTMRDKQLLAKLQEELADSWSDHTQECPSWSVLEKLPYFTAVIKETLRITGVVVSP
ncbi:trichodiene oxygenase [Aspergillus udagawae]|nr:trichodiene oxygenase [Aspergillus udagawae]